jgi:hypothetical protein
MSGTSPTTTEYWTWNGTSLNQAWWNIATIGGSRYSLPVLRGSNYTVPFQTGQVQRPKFADSRVITLLMWVAGVNQTTGNPDPSNQILAWNNNYQQLRAMFWQMAANGSQQGELVRQWDITQNGSTAIVSATANAEIASTMEPTMTGRTRADMSIDFLLADPYFYGNEQSQTLTRNNPTNVTNLGEGVAGEASEGFLTVTFNGTLTNPTLTNSTAGVSVTYSGSIASGSSNAVSLDCVNFLASSTNAGNVIGNVQHAGARRWMVLLSGTNSLELTSTGGSDSGNCVVQWQPPYL